MKYIKILTFETIDDVFKLILEGERIDIYYMGSFNNGTWTNDDSVRLISFYHLSDNFVMNYEGEFDCKTKKFKSLKISNITDIHLVEGGSKE